MWKYLTIITRQYDNENCIKITRHLFCLVKTIIYNDHHTFINIPEQLVSGLFLSSLGYSTRERNLGFSCNPDCLMMYWVHVFES